MANPTLCDRVGGETVLGPVPRFFADAARRDPPLAAPFAGFDDRHAARVTEFILKVLAGRRHVLSGRAATRR